MAAPDVLLVMGVSGAGKSTVGAALASKLGWKFYDADDYHPEENRVKMGKGIPLTDQDRSPWLCDLHDILLRDAASGQRVVLACSALKKAHRDVLRAGERGAAPGRGQAGLQLLAVHLSGAPELISGRLRHRRGHFMPPELLRSQFEALEPPTAPERFIEVGVDKKPSEVIAAVMEALNMRWEPCPVGGLGAQRA